MTKHSCKSPIDQFDGILSIYNTNHVSFRKKITLIMPVNSLQINFTVMQTFRVLMIICSHLKRLDQVLKKLSKTIFGLIMKNVHF